MKNVIKLLSMAVLLMGLVTACNESEEAAQPADQYQSLIGKVETRMATAEELAGLTAPSERTTFSCSLGSDVGCDEASSSVEGFIQNCTTYTRSWPPTGTVKTYYLGISYYVDSDDDINLDQYEDDLQSHVDQIMDSEGSAAFISGDVISWPCSNRVNNAGVIKYSVYK